MVYMSHLSAFRNFWKIVSEYDQEIPRSQTADNPVAPRGRAAQPPRDTRKTNQAKQPAPPPPHQDDRNIRTDTKQRTTIHRTITDSHNGSNNKQKVNNNRTTASERTAAQATGGPKCTWKPFQSFSNLRNGIYGEQEKDSIIRVRIGQKNLPLLMPNGDPREGFF